MDCMCLVARDLVARVGRSKPDALEETEITRVGTQRRESGLYSSEYERVAMPVGGELQPAPAMILIIPSQDGVLEQLILHEPEYSRSWNDHSHKYDLKKGLAKRAAQPDVFLPNKQRQPAEHE